MVTYELHIKFDLPVELSIRIDCEGALEETHLVDVYLFVLDKHKTTTFRMINFRVRKLLLLASISDALAGSMPFRIGLDLF
jgi:hypothetical protein